MRAPWRTDSGRLSSVTRSKWNVNALWNTKKRRYFLDPAIFCQKGKIDVEADGDTYHTDPRDTSRDNARCNDLSSHDWRILRFNGHQIRQDVDDSCIDRVMYNINDLGGLSTDGLVSRVFNPDVPGKPQQMALF
ncbi:MAG: DUF559 domain-containing protein [Anaerolineae bacterium]|nr:DUF559 domain-containing protein [Anaerolineae bacterium]